MNTLVQLIALTATMETSEIQNSIFRTFGNNIKVNQKIKTMNDLLAVLKDDTIFNATERTSIITVIKKEYENMFKSLSI